MPGEAHDRTDYAAASVRVSRCRPRSYRYARLFGWVARRRVIAALDQQPGLILALADSGQRIAAVQLLAVQTNGQVAAAKAGGHLLIGLVGVRALVPDDHAGGGVLDVGVLQRMVFGATG